MIRRTLQLMAMGACLWATSSSQLEAGEDCLFFRTDALLLNRTQRSDTPLVRQNAPGNPILDTADSLQFPYEGLPRFVFGYQKDQSTFEVSYAGMVDWYDASSVAGVNNLSVPGDLGLASLDYFAADLFDATYSSEFHDIQANYYRSLNGGDCCTGSCFDVEGMAGLRVFLLDEQFTLSPTDVDTGNQSLYRINTENHLIGPQLGLRMTASRGNWSFQAIGKAGVFANPLWSQQSVSDLNDTISLRNVRTTDEKVAVIGDLEFVSRYRVNSHCNLRFGYLFNWIEGVVLPTDQIDFSNNVTSGTSTDASGFLQHGFVFGFEAIF